MKIKLLVAAAATVMAGSVVAQSAFEGAYGQIGIGYSSINANDKSGTVGGDALTFTGNNVNSFTGNIGAGYFFGISKSFLLGVGAEYSPLATSKGSSQVFVAGVQEDSNTYYQKNAYSIFVAPALAIDKDKLAYAKLGYTSATFSGTSSSDGLTATSTFNGYLLGIGYKQIITGGLYGFAEGNYSMLNKKTYEGTTATSAPTSMNLLVGVGYKF